KSKPGRTATDLAVFARVWPGQGVDSITALGRQLEGDVAHARGMAGKGASRLRVVFALVISIEEGACDERLASGLKHAWTIAVRRCARDLRRLGVGCCGVVAASPVNGARRAAKGAPDLLLTVEQASHLVALVARGVGPADAGVI